MSTAFRITAASKLRAGSALLAKTSRSSSPLLHSAHSKLIPHGTNTVLTSSRLSLGAARSIFSGSTTATAITRQLPVSVLSSAHRRAMSTGGATTTAATAATEDDEPLQGSAPTYDRHLLICTGAPSKDWSKKPELSDPYHSLLLTTVRGQKVKVNYADTASDQQSDADKDALPSKGPRHDLILFPDNVKFKGIRHEAFRDLSRYLAQYPIGTLRPHLDKLINDSIDNADAKDGNTVSMELVPGSGEIVTIELVPEPSAVLVCIHGSRDCRCGDGGGDLYQILKDMVQATGLSNSIKIYGVSHLGGHQYAPNTITYPSGDWHGRVSVESSEEAQELLFDALANGGIAAGVRERGAGDPVMVEKWRGRMGMDKDEQLKLYQRVLKKQEQIAKSIRQVQETQQPQSFFSAPGEDLYQDDGLKEQVNAVSVESNKPALDTNTPAESIDTPRVKIVFENFQKVRTEIDAKVGERILDIVKDKDPSRHGVYQALECTCGGKLECATCHVYIEQPYHARLSPVTDAEEDMLEYAVGRRESSRLGCQIKIKPEMEGMVVRLPQY